MDNRAFSRTIGLVLITLALIVSLSLLSNNLWGGKPEKLPESTELIIQDDMTLARFGTTNNLSNPVLKEIFHLKEKTELQKKLKEFGTPDQIRTLVKKEMALATEHASKNWVKIPVKFGLWFIFLTILYFTFKKRKVTGKLRKWVLFISALVFGVIMGAEPGSMGTVKDAIHLYASARAIFPPRMIALTVFLLLVFIANKYICAWGCQAGVLQDLIFRFNQTEKRKAVIGKQIKLPFVLTNTIRFTFLILFTVIAFIIGYDIIEPIDPFKIYNPIHLGMIGSVFMALLLIAGLFIYRPWCHLFCPFGLIGWLVEKISRIRISVNYETCIACQKCAQACPSTVMAAILKRDKKTIPDCFACYTCRDVCPTGSISFSTRKRTIPPVGHFEKKHKTGITLDE